MFPDPEETPRARPGLKAFAAVLGLLCLTLACGRPASDAPGQGASPAARRPNVIVYLLDTIRADNVGAYGYDRPTTPHLDRWARNATLFERTIAPAPWTRASVASILTGLYPDQHQANEGNEVLADHFLTLPEALRDLGCRTAAFITNGNVSAEFGFDQGFDLFRYFREGGPGVHLPARDVHPAVLQWIDRVSASGPFFVYVHATDPHAPYTPPRGFEKKFLPGPRDPKARDLKTIDDLFHGRTKASPELRKELIGLYDGEIAAWDASFGVFLDGLKRRGLLDDTIVIFVGDHGEEFDDHGGWEHSTSVHAEEIDIPMVIRFPDGEGQGNRIATPVSSVDIFPTVLRYLGVDPRRRVKDLAGISLLGLLDPKGGEARKTPIFSSLRTRGEIIADAAVFGNLKLIRRFPGGPTEVDQLFDLDRDPTEHHDLFGERAMDVARLETLFSELPTADPGRKEPTTIIDPQTRRTLKALGYLD